MRGRGCGDRNVTNGRGYRASGIGCRKCRIRDLGAGFHKMPPMPSITDTPTWKALSAHKNEIAKTHMRDLFAQDPKRFEKFSVRFKDILLDFSKNRITEQTFKLLLTLPREARLKTWIERMLSGAKINVTENRAVLHVALRN